MTGHYDLTLIKWQMKKKDHNKKHIHLYRWLDHILVLLVENLFAVKVTVKWFYHLIKINFFSSQYWWGHTWSDGFHQCWIPVLDSPVQKKHGRRLSLSWLETVQYRATKITKRLEHVYYTEKLRQLWLLSWWKRKIKGFHPCVQILEGFMGDGNRPFLVMPSDRTRCNGYKWKHKIPSEYQ